MSEALEPNLLHRLRHTPMRDVIRGRLTGRLDVNRRIDASNLPAPAKELVRRVIRRTRLWSLEKVAVADELIAHFVDGIEAGETMEKLIGAFGDERRAAKLIRRAKKRSRPLAWHVLAALGWLALGLLAFYVALGVYFFTVRPAPKVNYWAELNRDVMHVAPHDRAWPLYRQALLAIGRRSEAEQKDIFQMLDARPGASRWPELAQWIESQQAAIDLMRQAARKPAIGFVLGPGGSSDDPAMWPARKPATGEGVWDDSLVSAQLPHLQDMGVVVGVLGADAAHAHQAGDGRRLRADFDALDRVAAQLRVGQDVYAGYLSRYAGMMIHNEIESTLTERPELLSGADLQSLAHRIAGPDAAADLVNLRVERLRFHDAIQRMYTDDGAGGGRMTLDGLRLLNLASVVYMSEREPVFATLLPTLPLVAAPRREIVRRFDAIADAAEARLARPRRDVDWRPSVEQRGDWHKSYWASVRYAPILTLLPSLEHVHAMVEQHLGRRDGVLVAIALELYRRQHGAYPDALDQLTPALLPRVPADRITGEPLRYRVVDGRPVVYSVGADRDDDLGRPPRTRNGTAAHPNVAAQWDVPPETVLDGDWILYPQIER